MPLYISVFVAVLGFSLVAPIFPLYAIDLGASYTLLGMVVSIYGAVQLVTQIPAGRLSDRLGRKPLMLAGLLSFATLPLLYIYATSAYLLLPIRAFGGVGASLVWPVAMAMIVDQASSTKRGSAMGWYNATFFSALAVGPAIGGGLYDLFGLRAPFYFWALLGAFSFVIVLLRVREPPRFREPSGTSSRPSVHPREELIRTGYWVTFLASCGVVMWTGVVGGFNFTLLPSLASGVGLSTVQIGILYFVFGGANALSNVYFGKAADRGRRKTLIVAGCAAGVAAFYLLAHSTTLLWLLVSLGVLGLASGMGNPAAAAIVADITSTSRRGEIFGIFNTARMAGVVIGPLVAGLSADAQGISGTLAVFLGIALTVTAASFLIREPSIPKAI